MTHISHPLDAAALKNLAQMIDGDESFLAELLEIFFRNAPKLLSDMRQAVERGDAMALALAAHSLKSNSATFGATTLTALCREAEMMGRTGALDGATEKIAQIEAEYTQVKPAIEALTTQPSAALTP